MRALVLSGGGSKGAYQIGALKHLLGKLQRRYDVLAGVSVGSLNSSFIAQFQHGEEHEAIRNLEKLWKNITRKDIYKGWMFFGKFAGLWKSSIYNNEPLQKLIRSKIDRNKLLSSSKELYVGAVSMNTGEYRAFRETNPNIIEAIIASSAMPVFFPPVLIGEEYWSDGGLKDIVPLMDAISSGATKIDVIMTSPEKDDLWSRKSPSVLDCAARTVSLLTTEVCNDDVKKNVIGNIEVNILRPNQSLIDDSLNFDHEKILAMIESGQTDAENFFGD